MDKSDKSDKYKYRHAFNLPESLGKLLAEEVERLNTSTSVVLRTAVYSYFKRSPSVRRSLLKNNLDILNPCEYPPLVFGWSKARDKADEKKAVEDEDN